MKLIGYFNDYKILIKNIYKSSVVGCMKFGLSSVLLHCLELLAAGNEKVGKKSGGIAASASVDESGRSESAE